MRLLQILISNNTLERRHFFRAWFYFDLLKKFGDLPWIDKPLKADIKELALERISRSKIVDKIVADLDKAIANMKDGEAGESNRLNKHIALAFKARVCLYEGTWEKYHKNTAFGVEGSDGTKFITLAKNAADEVIKSGIYELYKGSTGEEYISLFNKIDYSGNKEVLFWAKNDLDKGLTHNMNRYTRYGGGAQMTKSLVYSFLMKNGKAITESGSGYHGDTGLYQPDPTNKPYLKVHKLMRDRDPRLIQMTIHIGQLHSKFPDRPDEIVSTLGLDQNNRTGFPLGKGGNVEHDQHYTGDVGTVGAIIFRYAEVLLIYAEAQAELGDDTKAKEKIDMLRDRVGMARLSAVMPAGSNVLEEVRRERRIELAGEGFRFDDIYRWRAVKKYVIDKKRFKGVKYQGNSDLIARYAKGFKAVINVDGKLADTGREATLIIGTDIHVDANGFVDPYQSALPKGFEFKENRDYLLPINKRDITLSEGKLKQNPGWDE